MARRVDLILADKVYEFAVTRKTGGDPDKAKTFTPEHDDAICRRNPHHTSGSSVAWFKNLQRDINRAEKITLDDEFVRLVVRNIINRKMIFEQVSLARNPFNVTWLEWDGQIAWDEAIKLGMAKENGRGRYLHKRSGTLLRSSTSDGSQYERQHFVLLHYGTVLPRLERVLVNTEGTAQSSAIRRDSTGVELVLDSLGNRATYLLGDRGEESSWQNLIDTDPAIRNEASNFPVGVDMNDMMYNMFFSYDTTAAKMQSSFEREITEASSSISSFEFAALALINEAEIRYHYHDRTSGRRLASGKPLPYMNHRTVTIEVPSTVKDVSRYFDTVFKTAIKHRAHQVRGFWRTLHRHTSEERKVWIKPHVRGDASLGWVEQEHIVTTPAK